MYKECEFEECSNPVVAKLLCRGHYSQQRRGNPLRALGTPNVKKETRHCSFSGCERKHQSKGYCDAHYRQFRRGAALQPIGVQISADKKPTCEFDGCDLLSFCKGLCKSHYEQSRKGDGLLKPLKPYRGVRAAYVDCPTCGKSFRKRRSTSLFCSKTCSGQSQKSDLTVAIETKNYPAVIEAAKKASIINEKGCWIWQRRNSSAYGITSGGVFVHRATLEAKLEKPLGIEQAHHKCSNTMCVNPDHLEPVSQVSNKIEMHERNFYIRRIAQLEERERVLEKENTSLKAQIDERDAKIKELEKRIAELEAMAATHLPYLSSEN